MRNFLAAVAAVALAGCGVDPSPSNEADWLAVTAQEVREGPISLEGPAFRQFINRLPPVEAEEGLPLADYVLHNPEAGSRLQQFSAETALPLYPNGTSQITTYLDYAENGFVELAPLIGFAVLIENAGASVAPDVENRTIASLSSAADLGIIEARSLLAHYYRGKARAALDGCNQMALDSASEGDTVSVCISENVAPILARVFYFGLMPISKSSGLNFNDNYETFEETISVVHRAGMSGGITLP